MAQHLLAEAQVCQGLFEPYLNCMLLWDMLLSPYQQILSLVEVPHTCDTRRELAPGQELRVCDCTLAQSWGAFTSFMDSALSTIP